MIKNKVKNLIRKTPIYLIIKDKERKKKQLSIQKNGLEVLNEVQSLLYDLGLICFADFGTCLGLVREGHLLEHDLDIDVGVIGEANNREKILTTLEQNGFKLWRQYFYQGIIVEESYRYKDIKVDLNYYEVGEGYAKTWLFYMKPGYEYTNSNEQHVVEMTYSSIGSIQYKEFNGFMIALPNEPELLMAEKYGPNWKKPDKKWLYWESPAATQLDVISSFKSFPKK